MSELILRTAAFKTTLVGTEILRPSTLAEWRNYGEILRRVDEAKQWAVGDWLLDGKSHYGDGLYQEAAGILEIDRRTLENLKQIADRFQITLRNVNLTWSHHKEVASLKLTEEKGGKLKLSDEPDYERMQELLSKAETKEWSVRELREKVKQHKLAQQREIELANEPEKFKVIYADPPWEYSDDLIDGYGAAEHHYPTMSIQELCKLPVKQRAMENSVLFLWTTAAMIEDSFEVINAWGFKYKAQFVWDKIKHNYGHYNSVRHELLLICTRGSCVPQNGELLDSVQSVKRSDVHSEKPREFRSIIDNLYPEGARIELFARGKVPAPWKTWGLEV